MSGRTGSSRRYLSGELEVELTRRARSRSGCVPAFPASRHSSLPAQADAGLQRLITGEPLTPLVRLSMAADMMSPVANSLDRRLSFINADYAVYLTRPPQGEYVGIQPGGHLSERGVAVGRCVLHDLRGSVGFAATAAIANQGLGPAAGRSQPRLSLAGA